MSSSPRTRVARKAPVKKKEPFALHRALPSFFKPSAMDLVLFSRQLAVFLRAGVPLVPAAVFGTDRLIRFARLRVRFGPPIPLDDLKGLELREAAQIAHERLMGEIGRLETADG